MTTKEAFALVQTIEEAKKQIEGLEQMYTNRICSNCRHLMLIKKETWCPELEIDVDRDFGCNKFEERK